MEYIGSEDCGVEGCRQALGAWPCANPLTTQGRFLPNSVPGSQLQTVVTWGLPGRCLAEALCPDRLLSTEGHHSCPSIAFSQLFASGYQKKCPCGNFQTGFLKGFHMQMILSFLQSSKVVLHTSEGDSEVKKERSFSQRYVISTYLPDILCFYK